MEPQWENFASIPIGSLSTFRNIPPIRLLSREPIFDADNVTKVRRNFAKSIVIL